MSVPTVPRPASRHEGGQALVEFVLVLPFLALLLFGVVDFTRALHHWSDMNQMAAVGARTAAVNGNPGDADGLTLQEWILAKSDSGFVEDNATVRICQPDGDALGAPVEVQVAADYAFLNILGLGTTTISGGATMRMEARATEYTPDGGCT